MFGVNWRELETQLTTLFPLDVFLGFPAGRKEGGEDHPLGELPKTGERRGGRVSQLIQHKFVFGQPTTAPIRPNESKNLSINLDQRLILHSVSRKYHDGNPALNIGLRKPCINTDGALVKIRLAGAKI
jgi:hypothetical protein